MLEAKDQEHNVQVFLKTLQIFCAGALQKKGFRAKTRKFSAEFQSNRKKVMILAHCRFLAICLLCSLYSSPRNIQSLAKDQRGDLSQLSIEYLHYFKKIKTTLKGGK